MMKVEKKLSRWQKIIKEAAEQSYRLTIPNIKFKSNLKRNLWYDKSI